MIEISIGRSGQLQRFEADVVESLIVYAEGLVGVFDELMQRQCGVVWLNNDIGHLGP